MTFTVILLLIALVLLVVLGKAKQTKKTSIKDTEERWPFASKQIMTDREQAMFHRLRESLPAQFIILGQVDMKSALRIKSRNTKIIRRWLGVISQKILDFVVCAPDTSIIAVIELDDASHNQPGRKEADDTKERALKDAGIKFLRVNNIPNVDQIQKVFGIQPVQMRAA